MGTTRSQLGFLSLALSGVLVLGACSNASNQSIRSALGTVPNLTVWFTGNCAPIQVGHRATVFLDFGGFTKPIHVRWFLDGRLDSADPQWTSTETDPDVTGTIRASLTFTPSRVGEIVKVVASEATNPPASITTDAVGPQHPCQVEAGPGA